MIVTFFFLFFERGREQEVIECLKFTIRFSCTMWCRWLMEESGCVCKETRLLNFDKSKQLGRVHYYIHISHSGMVVDACNQVFIHSRVALSEND